MAQHIAEALEYDAAQESGDIISEGADSLVPAYNNPRLAWLASNMTRASYVDDAVSDGGWPRDGGIFAAIGWGMHTELAMIGGALWDAIEGEADDSEDD
jgi:hypothetical protein